MSLRLLSSIILAASLSIVQAQQFPIQKLTVEEGLGHSIVYRTYQTRNGYLWFSTDNGLTRYDGQSFTNYTGNDGLGSNFIFGMTEWNDQIIISSFGGGLYTLDSGRFKPLAPPGNGHPDFPLNILPLKDELWICDRFQRLHVYEHGVFRMITAHDLSLPPDAFPTVYGVSASSGGGLLVATAYGLYHYNHSNFTKVVLPGVSANEPVTAVLELPNKDLVLALEHQVVAVNLTEKTLIAWDAEKPIHRANLLFRDTEGSLWIATTDGKLYMGHEQPGTDKPFVSEVLTGIVLNDVFEDHEHNIWLATYGEGAWCIRSTHVRNYAVTGCIVSDMAQNPLNNDLIITTNNVGVRILHQNEGKTLLSPPGSALERFFRHRKLLIATLPLPDKSLIFSSDRTLYRWYGNGRIDSLTQQSPVASLYYQPGNDRIWIGGRFGLLHTDLTLRTPTPIHQFSKTIVRHISEDRLGRILIGTDKGIFRQQGDTYIRISALNDAPYYVNTVYTDAYGKSWVGTNDGLYVLQGDTIKAVDHPLAKARCNTILGDEDGNLWIGTVNGLLKVARDTYELITPREGIAQSNIIRIRYNSARRTLSLLSPNAVSVIEIDPFLKRSSFYLPDMIVEEIVADSRVISATPEPVILDKETKELVLNLAAPLIKHREQVSFTYQVNSDAWIPFDGRKIVVNNLPYGSMTLTVRVSYRNEYKTTTLHFEVSQPFYVTGWFIALMALLLLGAIFWIVNFYSRKRNVLLVEENKRLGVEHKALRNLLNPHFLYNAINSMHAFILQNDQRKTLAYLAKFSQLVRLNLELLASDKVDLEKEIKNIRLYLEFEKLRFADKLNYTIDIDPSLDSTVIQIPSFLIQPFVENAIWHGLLPRPEGGNLSLHILKHYDELHITIDDDGVGINYSLKTPKLDLEQKKSMGINIIKERLELLRKFQGNYGLLIIDKSELNGKATGTGTVVKITIPLDETVKG